MSNAYRRRVIPLLLSVAMIGFFAVGCASLGLGTTDAGSSAHSSVEPMDQERMERIFASQFEKITGGAGFIRSKVDGFNIFMVSDVLNDRMRLMVQIGALDRVDPRILNAMLEANVNSTLDGRYGISEGVIYSLFLHRMSTLTEEDLISAIEQTAHLARTFGTTFSSGKLRFGVPNNGDAR